MTRGPGAKLGSAAGTRGLAGAEVASEPSTCLPPQPGPPGLQTPLAAVLNPLLQIHPQALSWRTCFFLSFFFFVLFLFFSGICGHTPACRDGFVGAGCDKYMEGREM